MGRAASLAAAVGLGLEGVEPAEEPLDVRRRGRGDGSIVELPDGRWVAILSLGKTPAAGKRRVKKLYARTKKEAVRKLEDAKAARRQSQFTAGSDELTLAAWLDQWLSHEKGKVEPATWKWYQARVEMLKTLAGTLRLSALTALQVEDLHVEMTKQGYSADKQH